MPESRGAAPAGTVGDLAIVLHSHMPYVEGFGTYPFGEEWLFDAVIRSYLPVLELARDITVTITPVLADQLEDPDVHDRLREFLLRHRIGAAELDAGEVEPEYREAVAAEGRRYRQALEALEACEGDLLAPFRRAAEERGVCLAASSATHAVLPLLATRRGIDLQLDAGIRSHRRRFGWTGGFWLPECGYEPGIEESLARHGAEWFCVDQSRHEPSAAALTPVATRSGPTAFTIDWEAISWLWSLDGYPSDAAYLQFHSKSMQGIRLWRIGGGAYDPAAAAGAAARQASEFLDAARVRLAAHAERTGGRGLLVFAVDTELIGHWWSEGPLWLAAVLEGAEAAGLRLVGLDAANREHPKREARLAASTWGEEKDFRTWDAPVVSDLAWSGRRLELRLLRAMSQGLARPAAERAARELLAAQASDWAFLDSRGQAGDYPFDRVTGHARAMFQSIHSGTQIDPRMRNLAPDLSLSPLTAP